MIICYVAGNGTLRRTNLRVDSCFGDNQTYIYGIHIILQGPRNVGIFNGSVSACMTLTTTLSGDHFMTAEVHLHVTYFMF